MMDGDPLEPFLPIIATLATIIGQCCLELITTDMPSNWDEDEKAALISFLLEQKRTGKMGNGAFKAATMNAAAAHIAQVLPNARGGQKNGEQCKRQISSRSEERRVGKECSS